jgi:hypothetical protein
MNTVLVEVLHDGTEVVEAEALDEVMGDEAGGGYGETTGEEVAGGEAGGEYDETTGDEAGGEYDGTADEDEAADEDDETVDEGDDTTAAAAVAAEVDVPKISFCAPSWNPHLLLYAGLLG